MRPGNPAARLVYAGPYRVQDAVNDYVTFLGDRDVIGFRIDKHIVPRLGDQLVEGFAVDKLGRGITAWSGAMTIPRRSASIRCPQEDVGDVEVCLNLASAKARCRPMCHGGGSSCSRTWCVPDPLSVRWMNAERLMKAILTSGSWSGVPWRRVRI